MIRKPTLILLVILALLIGLALYLQRNPLPGAGGDATPSPTAPAQLFEGINSSNITEFSLQSGDGPLTQVTRLSATEWQVRAGDGQPQPANAASAEQARSEIAALRALAALPASANPADFGLEPPAHILTLRAGEQQHQVRIGKETAIGTGYYVQVDERPGMVVDKAAIDGILSLMTALQAPQVTPTTEGTANPALPAAP